MRWIKIILTVSALAWPATIAVGQAVRNDGDGGGGIWPTARMTELLLRRMAFDLRDQYELDEAQAERVEEMMQKRWTGFLREHRASLQPVLNRFFERQLSPTPPDPEEVASWADEARPLFDKLLEEVRAGQVEVRNILRPKQKMKFDADMFKFSLGAQLVNQRLQSWQRGEVNDTTLWNRSGGGLGFGRSAGRSGPSDEGSARREAGPTSRPAIDGWEMFVQRFIREHELEESQITTAISILIDLRDRATSYEERTAQERESLRRRMAELEGPVDKMFAELQTRLEGLVAGP